MGIFDKFEKVENNISLMQLKDEQYEQKYFETCKFIWKNYIIKSGQSNVLQGELLRELEKLRYEIQDNGNINWDEELDIEKMAYVDDNLYDIVADAIGKLQIQYPEPISFEKQ